MKYLEGLNEAQKQAVLHTEGPSMIIAGAGSGKTRVLTNRIAHLMEKGVDPFNILALTFTNKAAREMRERIEQQVGPEARNLWMGTFHSVFARILRAEADKLGYPNNFSIYDTDDSKSLIRTIIKEMGLNDKAYKPNTVLFRISEAKNNLVSVNEYLSNPTYLSDDEMMMRPKMGQIYKIYQERCYRAGAMDFDDLLFNTNVLFRNHVDALHKYQDRFKYALVDEFQDTNVSQYLITRKLSARFQNICVVGDDAQSIYAFRGANIQNILNFEKDFDDVQVFKLEQNYRSTQNIVNSANSLIANNKSQLKKNIWTSNPGGVKIDLLKANSDGEEGRMIANAIFEQKMATQASNGDFAVLYRTNSQSRSIEEALRRNNLKYRIYGGLSFYQRKEIKDVIGYLRYTVNPNDEEAFKRIINYPKRGIGETTVSKILVYANDSAKDLNEAVKAAPQFLGGRAGVAIDHFNTMIRRFQIAAEGKDAFDAASEIAKKSGLLKELYDDKTPEGMARHENVQELLNGIKEFVDNEENEDKSLVGFLQEVALITDLDKENEDDKDVISLMTIHASKGLEFKYVYIVGMEEDLFPSQMMISSREDLEEERRLCYVAMTRAEQKLTLSYAITRYRFGRLKPCEPSRFLQEINPDFLNVSKPFKKDKQTEAFEKIMNYKPKQSKNLINKQPKGKFHKPSENFLPSDTTGLQEGMRVEHQKFGFGEVKNIDESGSDRKAKVEFEHFGEKTLLLSFAKLMIHP